MKRKQLCLLAVFVLLFSLLIGCAKKDPEPQIGGNPQQGKDDSSNALVTVSTGNEFYLALTDPAVDTIELTGDISAEFDNEVLSRKLSIWIGDNGLKLSGVLSFSEGGLLVIDPGPNGDGTLELSDFIVTENGYDSSLIPEGGADIVEIHVNFKNIQGEPKLTEGLTYEISDDGTQAHVRIKPTSGLPSEAQVVEDFTLVLSGKQADRSLPGEVMAHDAQNGVLEIVLDNPVIDKEIPLLVEGGVCLKLTGSVTFDGGLYRFDIVEASSKRATVDISGLTINATEEVGKTKSDNIVFWRERNGLDVLYNEADLHLYYTFGGSGNDELRYVR